jgi:hypothetical protein
MRQAETDPVVGQASYHLFTQPTDPAVVAERSRAWNGDNFSFHDVLDTLNPLQHIPVVSTIYRYLTGDNIGAIPRIAGDTLYGGPLGFLAGLVGASLKQDSGKDVGETMVALVTGDDSVGSGKTAVAAADPPAATASAATGPATSQGGPGQGGTAQGAANPAIAAQAAGATVVAANQAALSGAVPAASSASAAATPASATVVGGSSSVASVAQTTGRATPAAAAADNDPRAAFLARAEQMRRQYSGAGGVTPTSKVVPLQGVGVPPSYYKPQTVKLSAPGIPGAPSTGGSSTPAPAATSAATSSTAVTPAIATPATDPTTAATSSQSGNTQATNTQANGLPSNTPVDISQHMMDALDKYMRLQQQRDSGSQVDVVH